MGCVAVTMMPGAISVTSCELAVKLTQVLSFAVALEVKHDSVPAMGKESTDSALTIGLEVGI